MSRSVQARDQMRSRLRPFGIAFEKSLTDLINGIRSHPNPTDREKFLQNAVAECRREARSADLETKTMAVLKLAYLEMYGFDMTWANFHVLEVMSSAKFQQKRVGYLAAIQGFRHDSDVLMLTTNLLKKDLASRHVMDISMALSGTATFVTGPLARDILDDVSRMLTHSRAYIRKKAVLALFKVLLHYPEALPNVFPRIRERLSDDDPSVVSAAVNVVCELAKKAPQHYVSLAPQLYLLLQDSHNNWMLIRLLKLFASLAQTEPRLKQKLLGPVLDLLEKTTADSLKYEAINCIVAGGMLDRSVSETCVGYLMVFMQSDDQNLKYVALLAFCKIAKLHPVFLRHHAGVILGSIDDADLSIRERVLELIPGIVSEDNIVEIVNKLMLQLLGASEAPEDLQTDAELQPEAVAQVGHLEPTATPLPDSYRADVVQCILQICSSELYRDIPSFEWYIAVLTDVVKLCRRLPSAVPRAVGEQLRDIAVRVPNVRRNCVAACLQLVLDKENYTVCPAVLSAVVWVVGEYAADSSEDLADPLRQICSVLTEAADESRPEKRLGSVARNLDAETLSVYLQALPKLYSAVVNRAGAVYDAAEAAELCDQLVAVFEAYAVSRWFEVQERSVEFLELFRVVATAVAEHPAGADEPPLLVSLALPGLFTAWQLKPVAKDTQFRIRPPPDLDLDVRLGEESASDSESGDLLGSDAEEVAEEAAGVAEFGNVGSAEPESDNAASRGLTDEEYEKRRQERLERQKYDPFYLPSEPQESELSDIAGDRGTGRKSQSPESGNDTDSFSVPKLSTGKKPKQHIRAAKPVVLADETIAGEDAGTESESRPGSRPGGRVAGKPKRRNKLVIDTSELDRFDISKPQDDEEEAGIDVEALRKKLAATAVADEPLAKPVRKKKVKKVKNGESGTGTEGEKKKKKKKKVVESSEGGEVVVVSKSRKKKANVAVIE